MEHGTYGLFPHDLAREVIDADLRWRDPAAYREVHLRVRRHVVEQIWGSEGRERGRALADLIFLHRGNPAAAALWDWKSLGEVYADGLRDGDAEAIVTPGRALRGSGVGGDRRALAGAPARGVLRLPRPWTRVAGLCRADRSARGRRGGHRARSRGARGVGSRAAPRAACARETRCSSRRFLIDRDVYQAPSRSFNVVTMRSMQEWLGRPRLSWYYIVAADPEAMAPLMDYVYFDRAAGGRLRSRRAELRGVRARLAPGRRRGMARADGRTRARRRRGGA